ncbi:MAG: hypothetical protein MZV63_58450 [Marinilabiliales bacterium]|nr:hypothetical protein [Marinilabiliales bacterium]
MQAGEWGAQPDWSFWKTPLTELRGKTMGIVGFGRIGRRVGELAHAFGMSVMAHDAFRGADPGYAPFAWAALEELFAASDVVSLHCPLTAENHGVRQHEPPEPHAADGRADQRLPRPARERARPGRRAQRRAHRGGGGGRGVGGTDPAGQPALDRPPHRDHPPHRLGHPRGPAAADAHHGRKREGLSGGKPQNVVNGF